MELKVRDRVTITDISGNPIAKGTIININDFREPNQKYAVDVDGYEDVLFFDDSRLVKITKPYSDEEYEDAKKQGLDLDDWDDYVKYFGLGEEPDHDNL